jgi:hypothetical protein
VQYRYTVGAARVSQRNTKVFGGYCCACRGGAGDLGRRLLAMYSAGSSQEAGKGNRIVALFESLRNEIEGAANEANMYRQQRDECERKRNDQIPLPHLHELLLSSSDCLNLVPCTQAPLWTHSIDLTVVLFWFAGSRGSAAGAEHATTGTHGARACTCYHDTSGMWPTDNFIPMSSILLSIASLAKNVMAKCSRTARQLRCIIIQIGLSLSCRSDADLLTMHSMKRRFCDLEDRSRLLAARYNRRTLQACIRPRASW